MATPLMFQPLVKYADFNGRARRSEYWLWALFIFLLYFALMILQYAVIFAVIGSSMHGGSTASPGAGAGAMIAASMILSLVRFVIFIGLIVPSVAVAVRRMHDINRTGWWIVFPSAVSLIAFGVVLSLQGATLFQQITKMGANAHSNDPSAMFAFFASMLSVFMWVFIPTLLAKIVTFVFRVTEGTRGTNRFGPDPKTGAPTEVF